MQFINMDRALLNEANRVGTFVDEAPLMQEIGLDEDMDALLQIDTIDRDLGEVNFSQENLTYEQGEEFGLQTSGMPSLVGFHTAGREFSFLGCMAGGDWECPLFFIVYHDGQKLRAYIPTYGNTFNTDFMAAFGSEADGPKMNDQVIKKYGFASVHDFFKKGSLFEILTNQFCAWQGVDYKNIGVNWDAIAEDIQHQFSLKTPIDR